MQHAHVLLLPQAIASLWVVSVIGSYCSSLTLAYLGKRCTDPTLRRTEEVRIATMRSRSLNSMGIDMCRSSVRSCAAGFVWAVRGWSRSSSNEREWRSEEILPQVRLQDSWQDPKRPCQGKEVQMILPFALGYEVMNSLKIPCTDGIP